MSSRLEPLFATASHRWTAPTVQNRVGLADFRAAQHSDDSPNRVVVDRRSPAPGPTQNLYDGEAVERIAVEKVLLVRSECGAAK